MSRRRDFALAGYASRPHDRNDRRKMCDAWPIHIFAGPSTAQEQFLPIVKNADGTLTRCSLGQTMFAPLTGRGKRADGVHGLIDRSIRLCYGAALT